MVDAGLCPNLDRIEIEAPAKLFTNSDHPRIKAFLEKMLPFGEGP